MGKLTRRVKIGKFDIGGGRPVLVQSMTKTDTRDVISTVKQIKNLERVGCEIVRVAVPDMASAKVLSKIKNKINIPLVADIHFNYRLALEAIAQGADKLRLNPGNITKKGEIGKIIKAAKKRKIPIRIGINSGSLEKNILKKYGKVTPEAMVESALGFIRIFEKLSFFDIVLSLKAADVPTTIKAYELISRKCDYPLHLGITEAGTPFSGTIKSAVGIGTLLFKGVGDTIRVSLTGNPEEEVKVGFEILKS
ncbi:flavodoxin-dependent (E)-4-hydroxy-3-methylbut-2-enyl-diphosphate synthase, partial [bacterium]|nr:flavodoxin-dependent (E)-4-hydroxy-3-methylbut-2-enyl-diphosphate synthase [bacterium]